MAIVAIVLSTGFCACSDDDDDDNTDAESALVGTWVEDTTMEYEVLHVQFNSDHTGYQWSTDYGVIDSYGKEPFTWKATSKTITVTMYGETETINYTLSGNRLTISSGGETIYYVRE